MVRGGLIVLLTVFCSVSLWAQTPDYSIQHREWEAVVLAGSSVPHKFTFPTSVAGSNQEASRIVGMEYDSGYLFSVRGTQNLGDFWSADLEYSFANSPLRFTNLAPGIPTLSMSHHIHHIIYNVSYLPLSRTHRFRPYVDTGAGAALFYIASHAKKDAVRMGLNLRDSWELEFNLGGGFKYLLKDQLALTFDVRDRLSSVPSYGIPSSTEVVDGKYRPGISVRGVMNTWQLGMGFSFQWDE